MSERNDSNQYYDSNQSLSQMPYKGAHRGADTPSSGLIASSHVRINDKLRKEQLKDIGLSTREDYIDADAQVMADTMRKIKRQKKMRLCILFAAMFILSLFTGVLVADFWGWDILVGLGIAAAIGAVLFVLPMIVYLLTSRR